MRIFFSKATPVQLQFLVWGFVCLFSMLTYITEDGFLQAIIYSLISCFFYAFIIYGNISFLFPRLYQKGYVAAYVICALLLLAAAGVGHTLISMNIYYHFFAKKQEPITLTTYLY